MKSLRYFLNKVQIWLNEKGDGYKPKLVVTYTTDTCTYSSGDWDIDAADDCVISTDTGLGGNSLRCTGSGDLTINALISNFDNIFIHGCCNFICRNTPSCCG
ncbi:MAG: hypothetical protein IIB81_04030 [Nanoarchaeota archaeon]|nr:hypothetical protein [Nanoarchaeota archaeon]